MITSPKVLRVLEWTIYSVRFFKVNFLIIFGLGLVAAFGRAIQLGAFGPVHSLTNTFLEAIVESARILIFLFSLGLTNIKSGAIRFIQLFTDKQSRKQNWRFAIQKLRMQWAPILVNLVVFSLIAVLINFLINQIAYETCLYAKLKSGRLIAQQASVWALILFFKNISVIPFTLIFNAIFFLWIINRLPKPLAYK